MENLSQTDQDKRVAPRRRVLKSAKIFINGGISVFDCTVRDISASGAKLSLGIFQVLPKQFKLAVNGFGTHHCELVRITGTEYGVRFVEASAAAA